MNITLTRLWHVVAAGELLQRMTSPGAVYGLALPDNSQYRGLVNRLPALVWERQRDIASVSPTPENWIWFYCVTVTF